jgi:hypothetical protein
MNSCCLAVFAQPLKAHLVLAPELYGAVSPCMLHDLLILRFCTCLAARLQFDLAFRNSKSYADVLAIKQLLNVSRDTSAENHAGHFSPVSDSLFDQKVEFSVCRREATAREKNMMFRRGSRRR